MRKIYDSLTANFADALVVLILVGLFPIASANTGPLFHIYHAATTTVVGKSKFWCSKNMR